jgi:hypothetical protein
MKFLLGLLAIGALGGFFLMCVVARVLYELDREQDACPRKFTADGECYCEPA